jgi:hypothetical protein
LNQEVTEYPHFKDVKHYQILPNVGLMIQVQDLGSFLTKHLSEIINQPIHVLQTPFVPQNFLPPLKEEVGFEYLYPSNYCQCSYPCQHMTYIYYEDQWYEYKKMCGDEIWKYKHCIPKYMIPHFAIYDALKFM